MNFEQSLLLIYTVATVIQVIVVGISLFYIYKQTSASRKSAANMENSLRLQTYLNHRNQVNDLNELFINNKDLADMIGLSKNEILGYMLIGWAETIFVRNKLSSANIDEWINQSALINRAFSFDFVHSLWPKVKNEYSSNFVQFIEEKIIFSNTNE